MLTEGFSQVQALGGSFQANLDQHKTLALIVTRVLYLVASLLAWRFWRFTLSPMLHPFDAAEYPYWIPVLGHGMSFLNNSNKLFEKARAHLGGSNKPMALTIFGAQVYVVSQGEDVSEVYRNTRTLDGDEFFRHVVGSIGTSKSSTLRAFAPPPTDNKDLDNPLRKPIAHLIRDMQIQQLQPGKGLDAIERGELAYLEHRMQPGIVAKAPYCCFPQGTMAGHDKSAPMDLSLSQWCSDLLVRAAQDAFFGDVLSKVDPALPEKFVRFDEISWKLWYHIPDFFARDTIALRDELLSIMRAFYSLSQADRNNGTAQAWVNDKTEDKLRAIGIPTEDVASIQLILYWGINAMTRKAAFWLISHLLHEPALVDAIRAETRPAFAADGSLHDLATVKASPHLEAAWNETMRMYGCAASVRAVTSDTIISGRVMRAGRRIMIPYRQLHFETSVFGGDVDVFRPSRWLNADGNGLSPLASRSDHFRPFGGGSTICPGRFLAKHTTMMFVALVLHRFDIATVEGCERLPEADFCRPVLGIMELKGNEDMRIRLRPRNIGEQEKV